VTYNTVTLQGNVIYTNGSGDVVTVTLIPTTWYYDIPNDTIVNPQSLSATANSAGAWSIAGIIDPTPDGSGIQWTLTVKDANGTTVLYSQHVQIGYTNGATQQFLALAPSVANTSLLTALPLPAGTATAGQVPLAAGSTSNSTWGNNTAFLNVKTMYGAKGDTKNVTDGAITASSKTLTSASANFTSADVGKTVIVAGAGASGSFTTLTTTIAAYVSSTSVTLTAAATNTVSSAGVCYGTDDVNAIQNAINDALLASVGTPNNTNGATVYLPPGRYLIASAGLLPGYYTSGSTVGYPASTVTFQGADLSSTSLVAGSQFVFNGMIAYGRGGTHINVCQMNFSDITFDGNCAQGLGGALNIDNAGGGGLVALPWPGTSAYTGAGLINNVRSGRYHTFMRCKFYRPTGYGFQPTTGIRLLGCELMNMGQYNTGAGGYDNLGSGPADAIVIGCNWHDSSGNFCDFVSGTPGDFIRMIMIGCTSTNHTAGGAWGLGQGSVFVGNSLQNNTDVGSAVFYDAGTAAANRSRNVVTGNVLVNMNGTGTNAYEAYWNGQYGDIYTANSIGDGTLGTTVLLDSTSGNVNNLNYEPAALNASLTNVAMPGAGDGVYTRLTTWGNSSSSVTVNIANSSGNICIALYAPNSTGGPGNRMATTGSVASPGTGLQTINFTSTVIPGVGWWIAIAADNNSVTFKGFASSAATAPDGDSYCFAAASQMPLPSTAPAISSAIAPNFVLLSA
jgi:hypothetical protein